MYVCFIIIIIVKEFLSLVSVVRIFFLLYNSDYHLSCWRNLLKLKTVTKSIINISILKVQEKGTGL